MPVVCKHGRGFVAKVAHALPGPVRTQGLYQAAEPRRIAAAFAHRRQLARLGACLAAWRQLAQEGSVKLFLLEQGVEPFAWRQARRIVAAWHQRVSHHAPTHGHLTCIIAAKRCISHEGTAQWTGACRPSMATSFTLLPLRRPCMPGPPGRCARGCSTSSCSAAWWRGASCCCCVGCSWRRRPASTSSS